MKSKTDKWSSDLSSILLLNFIDIKQLYWNLMQFVIVYINEIIHDILLLFLQVLALCQQLVTIETHCIFNRERLRVGKMRAWKRRKNVDL